MDRGHQVGTEVPQPVRMEADHGRRSRTVTAVMDAGDVLPPVCKQGVRGPSPLSSKGQKHNSNVRIASTAAKYSSSVPLKTRTDVRIGSLPAHGSYGPGQRILRQKPTA